MIRSCIVSAGIIVEVKELYLKQKQLIMVRKGRPESAASTRWSIDGLRRPFEFTITNTMLREGEELMRALSCRHVIIICAFVRLFVPKGALSYDDEEIGGGGKVVECFS